MPALFTLLAFLEVMVLLTDVASPMRFLIRLFGFLRFVCLFVGVGGGLLFLGLRCFAEGFLSHFRCLR